jgi:hypothetical protein
MARTLNAQAAAQKWAQRISQSGATWQAGFTNYRQAPNANPAQNTTNWQQGVAAAAPKFEAAISSASYLSDWQAGAKNKVQSYTSSGQAHMAKAQAGFQKSFAMITQALSQLPPKGRKGTNAARATAFAEAMHAQKGQGA